jgi:ABC-type multidrug transport system ATPase subunit
MTGNINSTSGEIYFNNMEIKNNKEEIRKLIGICP